MLLTQMDGLMKVPMNATREKRIGNQKPEGQPPFMYWQFPGNNRMDTSCIHAAEVHRRMANPLQARRERRPQTYENGRREPAFLVQPSLTI